MGLRGPGAKPVRPRTTIKPVASPIEIVRSENRAQAVIDFIESLPVTSGMLAGSNFVLRPWQRQIIEGIYSKVRDGKRAVRTALLTMPRKNGKTGLVAALALAHLCGPEAEARGQVYSAAADRNQASLIYNEMKAIIEAVPYLRDRIIVRDFTKHLEDSHTGSTFMALSSDAKTKHGFSASCIIYDELAQAPNRELYDALTTSTGARAEPLTIVISTQSHDPRHIMSELVDDGIQILDGVVHDETFFPCIYSAPENSDPWDEQTWFDCNPALGDFRDLEEMRTYAQQAQRIPAREATFRLLYLNQRIGTEHRFIARADWDACGVVPEEREQFLQSLKGRPCYGAVDLSSTGKNDLTSLVLIFPMEGNRAVLPFFWACESGLDEAERRDRAPYRLWAKQGHLTAIPGRVMDYGFIAQTLAKLKADYDLKSVAFDPWKIKHLIQACEDINLDLDMIPHAQSFKEMDPSIQVLEDDALSWRLKHDGNPVLTFCMDNIKVELDSSGNRKFSKRKSTGRIDGAVALAMAEGLVSTVAATPEYQLFFVG
jgi:phage terminase large subunit-like protein